MQECLPDTGIDAVDERFRAECGLDRRQGGEARRLQKVEDKVIDVPFTHAPQAVGVCFLDESVEGGSGQSVRFELRLQRHNIGPGHPARWCGLRGSDNSAAKSKGRGKGQYTHVRIVSEEPGS